MQTLNCKEPKCKEKVEYEDRVVGGGAFLKQPGHKPKKKTKTVYLTCPKGHTHSYSLPDNDAGE